VLGAFGRSGRNAGQFHWAHNLAIDSKHDVLTTEVDNGKRVQNFARTADLTRTRRNHRETLRAATDHGCQGFFVHSSGNHRREPGKIHGVLGRETARRRIDTQRNAGVRTLPAVASPRPSERPFRPPAESTALRIDALTGIRALAALAVVGYHFALVPLASLGLEPVFRYGYLGVDLFFLLSGFIIYYVHQRDAASLSGRAVLHFYGFRLARIYPVHLLTLCGLAFVVVASRRIGIMPTHPEDFRAIDFVYNVLLIQSWGVSNDIHWNFPAWSISCEWFVYLLFPLLALRLNRIVSSRQAAFWLGAETIVFGLAYIFLFHGDLDNKFDGDHFSHLALARVCLEFTTGALCCRLRSLVDMRAWPWTATVLAAILLAVLLDATLLRDFAIVTAFALAILAASLPGNLVARMLALPLVVYLGEISYSLYMVHAPIRMTLGKLLEPRIVNAASPAVAWALGIGFVLTTLAVAAATYHLVEVTARRWLRRQLDRIEYAAPRSAQRRHATG
jgi:peptidoglycan/LPS O-acetylase OafA/YrhL